MQDNVLIGLVDADLLDGGTKHPNLTLLKIAGFLNDNKIPFELIISEDVDPEKYTLIYMSKVFTFTQEPDFIKRLREEGKTNKIKHGGTGYYGEDDPVDVFIREREEDMTRLENDEFLNQYPNKRGGRERGIDVIHQMPFYDLYKPYINKKIEEGKDINYFKDYLNYSIGFLTRGCFRKCPFCVNRLEHRVVPYSRLEWFLDEEKPYIYLWDDNFFAAPPKVWRPLLDDLIKSKKPFQFRQGLDERMLVDSPYGEEIAEKLANCRYHGDYIFAFDNWSDRDKIEKALKIWKKYASKKTTKFYLFCGFRLTPDDDAKFYQDIWEVFQRIKVLMQYGCLGYIMRHANYVVHPLSNIYVQLARWCNQPGFYRNMSFWEFCYRNQSYLEEKKGIKTEQKLISYPEFEERLKTGYYNDITICKSLQTIIDVLERFPDKKDELLEMFNFRMKDLIDTKLWTN